MATEVNKNRIRGIGIPDPRITNDTVWSAESTYTEAGPESGLAVAATGNTGSLALVTSGEQTSGSALDVEIIRSGYPAVGGAGAQMAWRNTSDSATSYRGLEQPATITEQSLLVYDAGTTERAARDICTLPDGTQLALFETSLGGSTYRGQIIRKPAESDTWATGSVIGVLTGGTGNGYRYPCLIPVSNDLVLLVAWKYDSAGIYVQLVVHKSTDQGATWSLHSDGALESGALLLLSAYDSVGEIRGAYGNGEILLLAEFRASPSTIIDNRIIQMSSTDLGRSFDIVATSSGGGDNAGGTRPRVVHVGGVFLVSWVCASHSGGTVSGEDVRAVRIPSSTVVVNFNTSSGIEVLRDVGNFDSTSEEFVTATNGAHASQSMCVADDGAVYLTARIDQDDEAAALGHWCIAVSYDAGQTWQAVGKSAASATTGGDYNGATWWRSDVLTTSPDRVHVTYHQGRIVALCNWVTSAGTIDDSLSLLYLGGQSTLTLPSYAPYPSDTKRIAYESTYVPADLPAVHADYTVGVGTGSADVAEDASLNKLRLRLQTSTTGSTAYYVTATPPGLISEGLTAEVHMTYVSGDSTPNNQVGIRLRLSDGTSNDYTVRIDMGTSGYRVYDVNAGAYAAALVSVDMTAGVALRVSLNGGSAAVYHRSLAASHAADRVWTTGSTVTGLTNNTGSPGASNDFRWGHLAGASTTSKISYWYFAAYTSDEYNGAGLADGFTNPDELTGIPVTGPGGRAYLGRYVYAHGVSGYAHSGDGYTISAEYRYGVRNLDPRIEPSPQRTWRTTADSTLTEIAWRIDEDLNALAAPGNELLFIYLQGANFDEWVLKTHDGSSWSNLTPVTRNSAGFQSLPFTRNGPTVRPANTASGSRYIAFGELVGGTVDLGSGDLRKIVRNTEGVWAGSTNATTKRPTIWLDGVDGTEATSGNCDIWAPRMYCAVMRSSPADAYRGYKLTISSQATADGYYEIGALAIGWVQVFGYDNSADRELTTELRTALTESGSGIRFSRVDGLPRRAVALRWSTLIPTADWQGLTPDPAYRLATDTAGADPVALRHDALEMLEGMLRETEGAHVPVVYLPRITKGSPDTECSSSPARSLYGRIVGTSYTREVAQGNEAEDEAQRSTAGLVIEEEL
jgi:hypothetical protein